MGAEAVLSYRPNLMPSGRSKKMSKQMKNPRIIIDASYIRGMDESKAQSCFGTMCERGGRIVLIDTLVYELFTTSNRKQWPVSQIKLKTCANSIEVWKHVSVMVNSEIKCNHPASACDILNLENTNRLKGYKPYIPRDSENIKRKVIQEREYDDFIEMLKGFTDLQLFNDEAKKRIRNNPSDSDEIVQFFYKFINDPSCIREAIKIILQKSDIAVSLDSNDVDDAWVTWHFAKSLLVMYCYSQYKGKSIHNISRKKLINTKHDLDYLISLAFADAIASHDKREMSDYRQWMFGDKKPLIDSYCPENIARVMDSLKGDSSDRFSQDRGDKGQETLSQVDFMQLSLEERRQILAQQAEQLKSYYERTRDERTEWQTGDFIDVY